MRYARVSGWVAAFVFSTAFHVGAAAILFSATDKTEIAGGAVSEIAVLGSAFDAVASGVEADEVDPAVDTELSETQPVEQAEQAQPVKTVEAQPEEVAQAEPANAATTPRTPAQVEAQPSETASIEPLDETTEAEPAQVTGSVVVVEQTNTAIAETARSAPAAKTPEIAEPGKLKAADMPEIAEPPAEQAARPVEVAALVRPLDPVAPKAPVEETAPVAPEALSGEELDEPINVPVPVARPDIPQDKFQKPVVRKAAVKPNRPAGGNAGKSTAHQRKGSADGGKKGAKQGANRKGNASKAGNAAVSNYPGKVMSKLRRARRNLLRVGNVKTDAIVRFSVSRHGGLASVRLIRSSGSAEFDRAALENVRRAAPFPPIPAAAGRSSWPFDVPVRPRR